MRYQDGINGSPHGVMAFNVPGVKGSLIVCYIISAAGRCALHSEKMPLAIALIAAISAARTFMGNALHAIRVQTSQACCMCNSRLLRCS